MVNVLEQRVVPAATVGCPYCRSIFHLEPSSGETVIFLAGIQIGTWGTVMPSEHQLPPGEFFVQAGRSSDCMRICQGERDRPIPVEKYEVPDWMPPLCMEDCHYLHASLAKALSLPSKGADRATVSAAVIPAISCCWSRKLPVFGCDIWAMLAAHKVPDSYERIIVEAFDFGIDLTVNLNGRPANKRRRMAPMSRIRYLTKAQEPFWTSVTGHSNRPLVQRFSETEILLF